MKKRNRNKTSTTPEVFPPGDGLLATYPKGLQARLLPRTEPGTFLVEDLREIVRLQKPAPGKPGVLTVLGTMNIDK